ncbi:MAG: transposase [Chloroflexi bacterium]|nr:transposase [Chloroflexota bacterium]MCI0731839.1 transposase [Chloroflexota bacterium]
MGLRKSELAGDEIQLVEQHIIQASDPRYAEIDQAAFAAKNLWNAANYIVRQAFIHENRLVNWKELYAEAKTTEAYQALPRKVSNQVLIQLQTAWSSFFKALAAWRAAPDNFLGRPKLPRYKHKSKGRNLLVYEKGAIQKRSLKQGLIDVTALHLAIPTKQTHVSQVRIVPRQGHYVVEVVYLAQIEPNEALDPALVAGIDLNLDNLVVLAANKPGFRPILVNGRPLKSLNQFYNKTRAQLQSCLPNGQYHSARLQAITNRRNRRVKDFLHKTSRLVVDRLVAEGIGTLVIGYNKNWKQEIEIGRVNNQKFVAIPHAQLVAMLTTRRGWPASGSSCKTRATPPNAPFWIWRRLLTRSSILAVASIVVCFEPLTAGWSMPMSTGR